MTVRYRVGAALLAFVAFAAGDPGLAEAQTAWQPSPGHMQIPIWPGLVPDAGGHAFGLRRTSSPITEWPQSVERWLGTIGMIPK